MKAFLKLLLLILGVLLILLIAFQQNRLFRSNRKITDNILEQLKTIKANQDVQRKDIQELRNFYNQYQSDKVKNEIDNILNQQDPAFENISSVNPNSWPIFKHPDGIYSIRYHPSMVPLVTEPVEGSYARVIFVSKDSPLINGDLTGINGNIPGFRGELFFQGKGGGSWCTAVCIDVNNYVDGLKAFEVPGAVEPFFDEKLEPDTDGEYKIGSQYSFLPYENSKYELRLFSQYYTGNQREVLRLMYSTLKLLPDAMTF